MKRIWIRRNLILGTLLLCYVFFGFYVSLFSLRYTVTSKISFYPFAYDIQNQEDVLSIKAPSPEILKDEETIIKSGHFLDPLIAQWKLEQHPAYNPDLSREKILNRLWRILGEKLKGTTDTRTNRQKIKDRLKNDIQVTLIPYSEIHITVSSPSQKMVPMMADTLTDQYLKVQSTHGRKELLAISKLPETADFKNFYPAFLITSMFGLMFGVFLAVFWRSRTK